MNAVELLPVQKSPRVDVEKRAVVVIGGGQAGLAVGHHLARLKIPFVILDANERVGDSWRRRWDSLRLFTPARYDGLDGLPFPAPGDTFPTKDNMADYLEAYAARFALPVRSGTRVDSVSRSGDGYLVTAGRLEIPADHVVVAMSNYQEPKLPPFASELDPDIVQLHSSVYRSPAQLREGSVLIAGAGNSGAEIALELAPTRATAMSGRDVGHVPFRLESAIGRHVLSRVVLGFVFHRLLTLSTPFGRKARPNALHRATPLIRVKPHDLAAAGVERVARVAGVRDGRPVLADGQVVDAANVIWCTGYDPGFAWLRLPVIDERGDPRHFRGVVGTEPGLYFVGLHFLYAMSSPMIQGVSRDARYIAETIGSRLCSSGKVRSQAAA